jgi:HD-GYP domain-containing protein (c-di-GMP phosphodiesterase class II)
MPSGSAGPVAEPVAMPVIEVPIEKVRPGMYLVGIDVSWMKSPFYKHRFMISSPMMVKQLVGCGVKVITVDTDKGTFEFGGKSGKPKEQPPRNKELPPTSLNKELKQAKQLQAQSLKQLGKALGGIAEGGKTLDLETMTDIVEQSHDSTLRNAHALLSMFHVAESGKDLASHCFSVMSIALMLGQRMDLSDEELVCLGTASLLMDVGWSKLPAELFKSPVAYTEEEYEQIQQHVDFSVEVLEQAGFDSQVVDLVAKHHERLDGSGYFSQYAGDDVPLLAQIMSLADHYDSLIKGYYDAGPQIPATALKRIYLSAQKRSHSMELVELLIQLVGIFPVSSAVKLSSNERGVVTRVNWRDAMKPMVRLYYAKDGSNLIRPIDVDLYKLDDVHADRKIKQVINPDDKKIDPLGLLRFTVD